MRYNVQSSRSEIWSNERCRRGHVVGVVRSFIDKCFIILIIVIVLFAMAVTVQVRERVGFHRDVYNSLVKCLIRQRKTGEFCDVTLRVGLRCYHAHRAVLAAASPYFRSMFSALMKEQTSQEIDLSQSLPLESDESFKRVLDFMYCGDIEINIDNVEDVLRIADFLLFEDVKEYCHQFFLAHGNLNLSNCLWVSVLAEHHNLAQVALVASAMVRCRFHDYFVHSEEILDLPAQIFARLLADVEIVRFATDENVVRSLIRWASHDLPSRQMHLRWLMESVAGRPSNSCLMSALNGKMSPLADVVQHLSSMVDCAAAVISMSEGISAIFLSLMYPNLMFGIILACYPIYIV